MNITDKYVFFWGEVFSNWFPCEFEIDGIKYNCTEQYMMHQKALLFGDLGIAGRIMESPNPRFQKALGRQVDGFDKEKWEAVCSSIVFKANYAKFTQNEELKQQLLSTGNRILVEASPEDAIWGIGIGESFTGVEDPKNWRGFNLLGWALTLVRQEIT